MTFDEVCEKMHKFDGVHVTGIKQCIDARGNVSGTLEAVCYDTCNLPKDLLDHAVSVTQSTTSNISIMGNYDVVESNGHVEYNIMFKYDRKFLFLLNIAYEREEWKQANAEMDKFIEQWLREDG